MTCLCSEIFEFMATAWPRRFLCTLRVPPSLVISIGAMTLFLMTASWFLISFRSSMVSERPGVAEDIQTVENSAKIGAGDRIDGRSIFAQSNGTKKAEFGADTAGDTKPTDMGKGGTFTNYSGKAGTGDCDLYHGKWIYEPDGPLYTNNTCPVLTQSQNCQGNGRPDRDYENWRWKPDQCSIPRFDARKFLEVMRGKTLAFIGDSVARNQMESMLCILWQAETPRNHGNRRMQRWHFRSTSTTIVRIWSSWLVHKSTDALQSAPQGIAQVHLDKPDEAFMEFLPKFDIVVLSSGHWFSKKSIYLLNDEIVGSQLWHLEKAQRNHVNCMNAYSIATGTILTSIGTHPNYTGLTILRTYSPDHYRGGSCSKNVGPATELAGNLHTRVMHEKQVEGFTKAVKKVRNGGRLRLMDITEVFGYRDDGHPGRYTSPDAQKSNGRRIRGKPKSEDCLHWCMPGPVDIWNEILFEIISREFQGELN